MSKLDALLESKHPLGTPISLLLIESQQAYKDKDYAKALEFCNTAILHGKARKNDVSHLYELRSAVYVKLKEDGLALDDAKQMIRRDRTDARGYIRCAQIEQLSNNLASAINFYKHGLKNVPKTSPLHTQLESRLQRTRELAAKHVIFEKGTDPFQVLPHELLQSVLSYMTYRQIVAVLRVCKLWNNTLSSSSVLNDTIDFRDSYSKFISHIAVNSVVRRLGRRKKQVYLSNLNAAAARFTFTQLQRWVNWTDLEELRISDANLCFDSLRWEKYRLRSVDLDFRPRAVTTYTVESILRSCLTLQRATFHDVRGGLLSFRYIPENLNLNVLTINFAIDRISILTRRRDMETVNFGSLWPYPNISELTIRNARLDQIADTSESANLYAIPKTLELIDLSSCERLHTLDLKGSHVSEYVEVNGPPRVEILCASQETLVSGLPALALNKIHSLSMVGAALQSQSLTNLVRQRDFEAGRLRHLHLDDGRGCENLIFLLRWSRSSGHAFNNLESLIVKDECMHDGMTDDFQVAFPNLISLDIENPRITGAFIGEVLRQSSGKLTSLTLRHCDSVGLDTADWARERGVDVRVIRQHRGNDGGQRVRYG